MAQLGYMFLVAAALCAGYAVMMCGLGLAQRTGKWLVNSVWALHAVTGLLTAAVLSLLILLVQHDFQVRYVASYTSRALPLVYVFSALWAGQEGSLLFWGWLLAICSSIFLWKNPASETSAAPAKKRKTAQHLPVPVIERLVFGLTVASVLGFFLGLLLSLTNPFERLPSAPVDGNGMNPLLQNLYMAIHPPILFIGYAGFIVPFALAFAALSTGALSVEWLNTARRWTLCAWYFLGTGIILGAHWAYLELGWGGYWAWDPVENASLIPWLTGTALLHTLAFQRRKGAVRHAGHTMTVGDTVHIVTEPHQHSQGGMQIWLVFLSILTFALCIFATFVTRSGMINSVHAFGESVIGYYFLGFLLVVALAATGLLIARWKNLHSNLSVAAVVSKETSFLLTNQLFLGLGAAVLYGTLFPFFTELFTGRKIVVDAQFFNRITIPVGLLLLLLIGLCQRIPWKLPATPARLKLIGLPLGAALVGSVLLFLLGVKHVLTLVTCWFGLFVVCTIIADVFAALRQRLRQKTPETSVGSVLRNLWTSHKRVYTAYIFHVGMALVYVGIAISSAYKIQQEATLKPGESVTVGDLSFQYGQLHMGQDAQKVSVSADMTVFRNERVVAVVMPQKQFFGEGESEQMTTEVGLHSSLTRDIYVILSGWKEDQTATFTILLHPFILWIWIGGFFIFTLGFLLTILPARPMTSQLDEQPTVSV